MTVLLTDRARSQLEALERHYEGLGRHSATIRMAEAMAMAVIRIEEQGEQFLPYPRPYPALADLGWLWLKEGRYWVAFTSDGDHHVITVVFFDAADIPSRV